MENILRAGIAWGRLLAVLVCAGVQIRSEGADLRLQGQAGLQRLTAAFGRDNLVAYTPTEYCPLAGRRTNATPEAIRADLTILRPFFSVLVTYSCNPDHGLDQIVPVASGFGFRVVLGVWDVKSVRELATAVTQAQEYSNTVIGVIVGNETLLRGEKWENLEAAIKLVRAAIPGVPLSTSEPITSYGNDDLRQIVDFHSPTCHWLFQGGDRTNFVVAVAWLRERLRALRELPEADKPILIKEHGLPSGPEPFSTQLQVEYWELCRERIPRRERSAFCLFEAFDLPWKSTTNPSEFGATEAHWGAWSNDRQPKPIVATMERVVRTKPRPATGDNQTSKQP